MIIKLDHVHVEQVPIFLLRSIFRLYILTSSRTNRCRFLSGTRSRRCVDHWRTIFRSMNYMRAERRGRERSERETRWRIPQLSNGTLHSSEFTGGEPRDGPFGRSASSQSRSWVRSRCARCAAASGF